MMTIEDLDQRRRESKGRLIAAIYRMVKEERGSDAWKTDLEIILTAGGNVVSYSEMIEKRKASEIVDLTVEQLINAK